MLRTMKPITCLLAAMTLAFVIADTALAGKPVPPPAAPVKYRLTWIGDGGDASVFSSEVFDLNDKGVAVGRLYWLNEEGATTWLGGAFRWTAQSGLCKLDDLIMSWIDLDTGLPPVATWYASSAWDINEAGEIAGNAATATGLDYNRCFFFDPTDGCCYLLPTTAGTGTYYAQSINEAGEVMGEHGVDGSFLNTCLFFWTPNSPSALQTVLPGNFWASYHKMSESHFIATPHDGTDVGELYSYSVTNGTLIPTFVARLDQFAKTPNMSRNSLLPFRKQSYSRKGVLTYSVGIYDANTGLTIVSNLASTGCLPSTNTAGDLTFNGTDGTAKLYRSYENTTYKLYDLLDASARTALYVGTSPKSVYDIGECALINNSNAGIAPTASPYDHIAARYYENVSTPWGTKLARRAYILTPIKQ